MKIAFNIIEKRTIFFAVSLVIIIAGALSVAMQGFNLDIDFTGGTTMHIDLEKTYEEADFNRLNTVVSAITGEAVSTIQRTGDDGREVIIKMREVDSDTRNKVFDAIKEEYDLQGESPLAVDNVSSSVGADLRRSAFLSAIAAAVLMLIYITIRFEFITGLSAVLCLLHDVLIILAFYSFLQVPMNTNFIAAILTVLGYSINATIIIFDRVRENMRLQGKKNFADTVNQSIWQTMARSVNTSITTLFVITCLLIFGVESIQNFSLPITIGIIAGTYSSVFLSGNVWVLLKDGMTKKQAKK